jgi:signal transduction histidine kinase
MLAALERSLKQEREFFNNASHELRTPLTLLTSRIQLARRRRRTVAEHEQTLDELALDVTRLSELTEQLLELSRRPAASSVPSDVTRTVALAVERRRAAQPEMASRISLRVADSSVLARMDALVLERLVTNLLDNALTHGRPPVRVEVRNEAGHAAVEVSDAGAGMSDDLLAQATRRFFRAPEARSRPGAGLGLSIVEQLVSGAGGELRLCHGGHHASTGVPSALPCRHGVRMTVTVILPGIGHETDFIVPS